jgi:antirestriction protein ArdC
VSYRPVELFNAADLVGPGLTVQNGGDRASYLHARDKIHLPIRSAFHSSAADDATWADGVVHSTGHSTQGCR